MDCRCSHHCRARQAWFQQPAPPYSHFFAHFLLSGSDALPIWRWPAPPTLSFKNPLQKPTGDVTDTTSNFFTVYGRHPCTQPFQLLTLLMCQINHFQLESNITILKLGTQKVSYLRHARRSKLFFHKHNRNCSPDAYPSLLRAIPLSIPKCNGLLPKRYSYV